MRDDRCELALVDCAGRTVPTRFANGAGLEKTKLNRSGRLPRAISSTSRKPAVVIRPVFAPLRSVSALMTIVVPCAKAAISS